MGLSGKNSDSHLRSSSGREITWEKVGPKHGTRMVTRNYKNWDQKRGCCLEAL